MIFHLVWRWETTIWILYFFFMLFWGRHEGDSVWCYCSCPYRPTSRWQTHTEFAVSLKQSQAEHLSLALIRWDIKIMLTFKSRTRLHVLLDVILSVFVESSCSLLNLHSSWLSILNPKVLPSNFPTRLCCDSWKPQKLQMPWIFHCRLLLGVITGKERLCAQTWMCAFTWDRLSYVHLLCLGLPFVKYCLFITHPALCTPVLYWVC